ncbi:spermatogenesis-associated protein 4 [Stegostoma tigrinum]|uniref:spermatogenesis-associated protein 4 n=1 Tax=Stegostoma tigrinum TaxID=3053191 RepID=UPI00202B49B5|nr:spermatogenesis-associated protein 4 [Stegostoma tigrinum]
METGKAASGSGPGMIALPQLSPGTSQCWIPQPGGGPSSRAPVPWPVAETGAAFAPLQARAGLAREVIKWLQSLDLKFPFKHVRKAFSNGYLVAEIFSWYYPQDIDIKVFNNGVSFPSKLKNWSQLEHFFFKKKLNIPKELIYATMHSKPGGAEYLIQHIYTLLTNRQAKLILDDEMNFMDYSYQLKLPLVARTTATSAIRTNLTLTEVLENPDIFTSSQRALAIINMHVQHRQLARLEHPKRYKMKPTLGERATRLPIPQYQYDCLYPDSKRTEMAESKTTTSEIRSKSNVLFKEINVKQVVRDSQSLSANRQNCNFGQ